MCYKGTALYITKEAQENTSRKGIFDMYIHIDWSKIKSCCIITITTLPLYTQNDKTPGRLAILSAFGLLYIIEKTLTNIYINGSPHKILIFIASRWAAMTLISLHKLNHSHRFKSSLELMLYVLPTQNKWYCLEYGHSLPFAHKKYGLGWRLRQKVRHLAPFYCCECMFNFLSAFSTPNGQNPEEFWWF